MFLIFGSVGFLKNLGETDIHDQCSHCNNEVDMIGRKMGKKFTLFWIPLFPISTKYFVLCPICSYGSEVEKIELEKHLIEELYN